MYNQGILYTVAPAVDPTLLKNGLFTTEEVEDLKLEEEGVTLHLTPLQARPIACTPLLKLTDRTGGFANLTFEYPGKGRNLEEEKGWERDLLETDFKQKIVGNSHYFCPLDKVYNTLSFLLDLGWKILDAGGRRLHRLSETDFTLSKEGDTLALRGKLKFDDYERPLEDVAGTFTRKERFLELAPGEVGLMPPLEETDWGEWLQEEPLVVEGALIFKKHQVGLFGASSDLQWTFEADKNLLEHLSGKKQLPDLCLPSTFKGELRPYQALGVSWLSRLKEEGFSALLADEMGLGKTVQVLAFLSLNPPEKPVLVVVPTSLLFNWESEIHRFLPNAHCRIFHGAKRSLEDLKGGEIVLTTYGMVREEQFTLSKIGFQVIVLDEAHLMKNEETKTAQALLGLKGDFRLSMSGTPVENHLKELYSHFRFLIPGLLGDKELFLRESEAMKVDRRYLDRLQKKIAPFFLRRRKSEVAKDLPPLTEQTVFVEMPPEQREIYDRFLRERRSIVLEKISEGGIKKARLEIFEILLRLRQLAIHPELFPAYTNGEKIPSGKIELLLEDIQQIVEGKEKALVYSQFTSCLALIKKELDKQGIPYVYLDGSTTNRKEVVDRFQQDKEIPIFLMSLKAGGVGLNLTEADYVLLLDPWWNSAAEDQAIGRSHRIGRTKPVIAKRYISRETIEEKMLTIKKMKKDLAINLFDEEGIDFPMDSTMIEELLS